MIILRRLVPAVLLAATLAFATGARSSEHAAAWTWNVAVPGDATAADAQLRQLAAAGDLELYAEMQGGHLLVGPAAGQLQPLTSVAEDGPLVVFTAANATASGQELVGVARSDVDQVEATLADGTQSELPLNQWRGFSYVTSAPDEAAVTVQAYTGGTAVGSVRVPQTTTAATAAASVTPLYGIARASLTAQTVRVERLDPRTLHPNGGQSLLLHSSLVGPVALSPDAQRLALVTGDIASSAGRQLRIVDLQQMRVLRTFHLAADVIRGLSWPQPNRLLELRQTMGPPYNRNVRRRVVWAVDPGSGTRVGSATLTNKLAIRQSVSTPEGLVLLLGAPGLRDHAPSQLVSVDADAHAKSTTLPLRAIKGATLGSRLAVDDSGSHAYVVAPGGIVFYIDLTTMATERHQLAPPAVPATPAAIGIADAEVIAGKLALTGFFTTPTGAPAQGVALVDPTNWSTRLIDASATRFTVLGDRLVTYGMTTQSALAPAVGHGLTLYDASGDKLAHLYGSRSFENLNLVPGYGHVIYNGKSSGTLPKPGVRYPRRARLYYAGPNDQLAFDLTSGKAAGGGPVSTHRPPLGVPMLLFRGSSAIGETGNRQPASIIAPTTTTTSQTQFVATQQTPASATPQTQLIATRQAHVAASTPGYRISNPGRPVAAHGHPLFDERFKYQLYLLGTIGGEAFYRVQVTPHYRCYGAGSAQKIGTIGELGCPTVVGAYPLQLDDTLVQMTPKTRKAPTYRRVGGLVADGAVKVDMRDNNGKTLATAPVTKNLFAFQPPYPKTFIRLVPVDSQGNDLTPHPQWGEHQQVPPFLFGPRATKVLPSRLKQPMQHASADGTDVTVGRNGVVVMKLEALDAQTHHQISGKTMGVSCFVVSPTIRHTRGAGTSLAANGNETAFKILGYIKPPFDGCEISGSYGHRWHDQWGTHSPIEVPLTPRGQRYFDNRAAARDLALFVRSREMHQLRKLHGPALVAAIRKHYVNHVTILDSQTATAGPNTVGVWTAGARTVISERSSAGGRFYVEIDNGKITKENVRGLAFVF